MCENVHNQCALHVIKNTARLGASPPDREAPYTVEPHEVAQICDSLKQTLTLRDAELKGS